MTDRYIDDNKEYIVLYCGIYIDARETEEKAENLIKACIKTGYYYNDENHPFTIYKKIERKGKEKHD